MKRFLQLSGCRRWACSEDFAGVLAGSFKNLFLSDSACHELTPGLGRSCSQMKASETNTWSILNLDPRFCGGPLKSLEDPSGPIHCQVHSLGHQCKIRSNDAGEGGESNLHVKIWGAAKTDASHH